MNTTSALLLTLLVGVTLAQQQQINRVTIRSGLDSAFGCWLHIRNDQQILDLRTTCPVGNNTERVGLSTMMQLIDLKKAYYFKQMEEEVRGYRYVKDTMNYYYKFYNFQPYHASISQMLQKWSLSHIKPSFDQNYELQMQYVAQSDEWKLRYLHISYHTPRDGVQIPNTYAIHQWLQKEHNTKSIAKRFLSGEGDDQPVNITLELSAVASQLIKNSSEKCSVVIEEIIPEWFFISYDDLHTVDKFQVFDIQLPTHFAKQYFFRYHVPISKFKTLKQGTLSYRYSMKVRYPPPADDYTVTVGLHPNDKITINCGSNVKIEVQEDHLFDRGHKEMFAGREQDNQLVTMGTYALTLILVIWSLRRHKKAAEM